MNEIPIIFVGVASSCFSTGRSVGSDRSRLVQSDTCAVAQRFHGEGVIKPNRIGGHRDCQRPTALLQRAGRGAGDAGGLKENPIRRGSPDGIDDGEAVSINLEIDGRLLAAALVALRVEGDLLSFSQVGEASALNGGDMDEHVLTTALRLDESIALLGVEPFDCAGCHNSCPIV